MISGPNRTFYAFADSADEINSWVTAIQEVISNIGKPKTQPTEEAANAEPQQEPVDEDKVIFAGFMFKEAAHSKKNWRKRYFVLRAKTLTYYKEKDSVEPQGIIQLPGATLQESTSGQTGSALTKLNFLSGGRSGDSSLQFSITCPADGVTYELECRTPSEKNLWTQQIQKALEKAGKYVPTANSSSSIAEDDDEEKEHASSSTAAAASSALHEQEDNDEADTAEDEGGEEKEARFLSELRVSTSKLL